MSRRGRWIAGAGAAVAVGAVVVVGVWLATPASQEPGPHPSTESAAPRTSTDVIAAVQDQWEEHLDACTAEVVSPATVPSGCGIAIPWGTEFSAVDTVRFRIEEPPTLELRDGDRFVADDGALVATVTGAGQDGAPRVETYRTTSWSLTGTVDVVDGHPELHFW